MENVHKLHRVAATDRPAPRHASAENPDDQAQAGRDSALGHLGGVEDVGTAASSVPRALIPVLISLTDCSEAGRTTRLRNLGPGSRIVLRALGLTTSDDRTSEIRLTNLGVGVAGALAESADTDDAVLLALDTTRNRFRAVSRVMSTGEGEAAALVESPGLRESPGEAVGLYTIVPEGESMSELPTNRPTLRVVQFGPRLRVWQQAAPDDVDSVTLFDQESMEPLPRVGQKALVVKNPDQVPPSQLLRHVLLVGPPSPDGVSQP